MGLLDPLNAAIEWGREFVVHWAWQSVISSWSWMNCAQRFQAKDQHRLNTCKPEGCKSYPWSTIGDDHSPLVLAIPPTTKSCHQASASGNCTGQASPEKQGSDDYPALNGIVSVLNETTPGNSKAASSTIGTEHGENVASMPIQHLATDNLLLAAKLEEGRGSARGSGSLRADSTSLPLASSQPSWITCCRFSADGGKLVLGHSDGRVQAFSLEGGECLVNEDPCHEQVADCCFAPASSSDMVLAIDIAGNFMVLTITARRAVHSVRKAAPLLRTNSKRTPVSLKSKLGAADTSLFQVQKPAFSDDGRKLLCPVRMDEPGFSGLRLFVFATKEIPHLRGWPLSNVRNCYGRSRKLLLEDNRHSVVEACSFAPSGRAVAVALGGAGAPGSTLILWPDYKADRKSSYVLEGSCFCWSPDSALLVTWEIPAGDRAQQGDGHWYVYEVLRQRHEAKSDCGHWKGGHIKGLDSDKVVDWCGFLSPELVVTCSTNGTSSEDGKVEITVWDALRREVLYENLLKMDGRDVASRLRSLLHRQHGSPEGGEDHGHQQLPLCAWNGLCPLAISHERRWLALSCPLAQSNEVHVWDAEMGVELAKFVIPPAKLAPLEGGSIGVLFSRHSNKLVLVGAAQTLVVCLNVSKEWRKYGTVQDMYDYLAVHDPVALNYPDYRGMSILLQCMNEGNEIRMDDDMTVADCLKSNMDYALRQKQKIQLQHPPSLFGSRNNGDALYLSVKRRHPEFLGIILESLLKGVTTDYALSDIFCHSLVKLAQVYPDKFCATVDDPKFLRGIGQPFRFQESAFRHHGCAIGDCSFLVMTDDRLLSCPLAPSSAFLQELWDARVPGPDSNCLYVEAKVIPVKDIAQMGNRGLIRKMLLLGLPHNLFGTLPVKYVIAYKWRTYAFRLWVEEFLHYTLLLVFFTLYILLVGHSAHAAQMVLLFLSVVMAATNLVREIEQVVTYCKDAGLRGLWFWLFSYWNLVEVTSYFLLIFVIPAMVLTSDEYGKDYVWLSNVLAVEVILVWWRMLYYAQSFERTGPMVIMILEIISDIRLFLFLGFSVMFGFGLAFYLIYRHVEDSTGEVAKQVESQFGSFWRSLLTMFSMMLGNFEVEVLHAAPTPGVAILLFLLYMMGMMVVLLNLLIAIMNHSFTEIKSREETKFLRARAEAIDDIESMLSKKRKAREAKEIRRYLHVLIPKTGGSSVPLHTTFGSKSSLLAEAATANGSLAGHSQKSLRDHLEMQGSYESILSLLAGGALPPTNAHVGHGAH